MNSERKYKVIGLMSGTSLDGLDIAYCEFVWKGKWEFRIVTAYTHRYSAAWRRKLSSAHQLGAAELLALHSEYGRYLGDQCKRFIAKHAIQAVNFIASHGHTVFHQPERKFTFQLGHGAALHAAAGLPVICEFRSLDVALGGEGAPLVPVGDKLLFAKYDVCLNLGGIANLSMESRRRRIAFDVAYCNMAMNYLMNQVGKSFDRNGSMAASGRINVEMLARLNELYTSYRRKRPSLAREMFEHSVQPWLDERTISLEDKLRTVCESVTEEISHAVPKSKKKLKLLATGGGAHNKFLIRLLEARLRGRATVVVPPRPIIEFKEAMVFAFLAVLRMRNEVNVLRYVTKADRDSCSGVLIGDIRR